MFFFRELGFWASCGGSQKPCLSWYVLRYEQEREVGQPLINYGLAKTAQDTCLSVCLDPLKKISFAFPKKGVL
jgi:hypothetical protein